MLSIVNYNIYHCYYDGIIRLLIDRGIDLHASNDTGNSIFHLYNTFHHNLLQWTPSLKLENRLYLNDAQHTPYMFILPYRDAVKKDYLDLYRQNNQITSKCSICEEEKEFFVLENCGHFFCSDCLNGHLSVSENTRASQINCPHRGCKSSISVADLSILHPNFADYENFLTENYLNTRKDFFWCVRCSGGRHFTPLSRCADVGRQRQ